MDGRVPVGAGDGAGATGRAARNFVDPHLSLEAAGQADNDHSLMQQRGVRGENGRLLAAVPQSWMAAEGRNDAI